MRSDRVIAWVSQRALAIVCSACLAALAIALAVPLFVRPESSVIRVSAGPEPTRRQAIAVALQDAARDHQLPIDLVASKGSEDCLNLLKAGELDAAIICSGVRVPGDDDVVVLGALQMEAVHLLVRKELADGRPVVEVVRGKQVNFGQSGSAERLLAQEFCKFARLKLPTSTTPGDIVPTNLSKSELLERSLAISRATGQRKTKLLAELPDCVPVVETLPSPLVQMLVEYGEYDVVSMPATRAFLMDNLQAGHSNQVFIQREFLERTTIPVHCYFGQHPVPSVDRETVGVRLLVVARKSLPASVVEPLMATIFEGKCAHQLKPSSPRDVATPYLIHPAAEAYFDRDKPLLVQSILQWASQGLSFCGAFGAGALSLYGLLRKKNWRQPVDYFAEIHRVELAVSAEMDAENEDVRHDKIQQLSQCLGKLRHELVEDVCAGRIKGDQAIFNILLLMKDVRRTIAESDRSEQHHPPGDVPTVQIHKAA